MGRVEGVGKIAEEIDGKDEEYNIRNKWGFKINVWIEAWFRNASNYVEDKTNKINI